jgi:hypothetical protein
MLPYENYARSDNTRYIDPLIEGKIHQKSNPWDRERVAAEDGHANRIIWQFAEDSWSRYPYFTESDNPDAPEIMMDWRAFFQEAQIDKPFTVFWSLAMIHGWSGFHNWVSGGKLDYMIYSQIQCREPDMLRNNPKDNKITHYNVNHMPRLPLNRSQANIRIPQAIIPRDQPGNIVLVIGDEKATFGFGISEFEDTWDPITKLRQEDHADALRARVFPFALVPSTWGKKNIDKFFEKLKHVDQSTAMVNKVPVDPATGAMVDTLPKIEFMSAAKPAPQNSQSAGLFGGLSPAWARFLSSCGYTLGYFFGAGAISASLAAGGVDMDDDTKTNVKKFNKLRGSIKSLINWVWQSGLGAKLGLSEPVFGFVTKSWWQYEHEQRVLAMAEATEERIGREDEAAQGGSEPKTNTLKRNAIRWLKARKVNIAKYITQPKENVRLETEEDLDREIEAVKTEIREMDESIAFAKKEIEEEGAERGQLNAFKLQKQRFKSILKTLLALKKRRFNEEHLEQLIKLNTRWIANQDSIQFKGVFDRIKGRVTRARFGKPSSQPLTWIPVNSKTGNVKEILLDPKSGKGGSDRIFINFKGGDQYLYESTSGENFGNIADRIQLEGGEAIWRELRGLPSPGHFKEGETPKGTSKKGGIPNTPLAGRAHQASYEFDPASQPTQEKVAKKAGLFRTVGRILGLTKNSLVDMSRKNFNAVASELYGVSHGIGTIDKIKQLIKYENTLQNNVLRVNEYKLNRLFSGKTIDFNVDLKYKLDDGSVSVERMCKRDWKNEVVGTVSTVQLFHKNMLYPLGTIVFGWDYEKDDVKDVADFTREDILRVMKENNIEDEELIEKIKSGKPVPVSTEYFAEIEKINGIKFQRHPKQVSLAIVPQGNCPDDICYLIENVKLETEEDLDREIAKVDFEIAELEENLEELQERDNPSFTSGTEKAIERQITKFSKILQSLFDLKKARFG